MIISLIFDIYGSGQSQISLIITVIKEFCFVNTVIFSIIIKFVISNEHGSTAYLKIKLRISKSEK